MKKLIAFFLATVMLFSFAACGGGKKEKDVLDTKDPILRAAANLFDKFTKEGGTIKLTADGEAMEELERESGFSIENLTFMTDTEQALFTMNGKVGDKTLNDSLYFGESVVVNSPAILGGSYGIHLGTWEEDMEDSIFLNDKDFDFEKEDIASMKKIFGTLAKIMNGDTSSLIPGWDMAKAAETIGEFAKEYCEKLTEIYPVQTEEKDGFTITTLTVSLDKMDQMMEVLADMLEDKDVQDLIDQFLNEIAGRAIVYTVDSISAKDLPELVRSYAEMLDSYKEMLEITFTVTRKTAKDGMESETSFALYIMAEGEDGSLTYSVNEKMTDSKEVFKKTMVCSIEMDGNFEEMITQSEEDYQDSLAFLVMMADGGLVMTSEWNKKTGDFTASETIAGEQLICVEGNLRISNSEMLFVYDKIEAGAFDSSEYLENMTIEITAGKPKGLCCPEYVNVFKMSKGDLVDFVDTVQTNLPDLGLFAAEKEEY